MLTADHHHSPPRRSPSPADGSFLQMPLSLLGSVLRKQNASPAPAASPATKAESTDAALDSNTEPKTLMRADSDGPVVSPPLSRAASLSSRGSTEEKPKKRAHRSKTAYNLAQPPHPRQKLHIRPKVLLQLHQVVASRRPKPVYEVIPYSILAPVSTRRLARSFRGREKLGAHDLLIVKAEEYESNEEEKSDDERWGARDVVGIICPGKEEKGSATRTEVLMENGTSWEVASMPNGGYEFSCTDDHGLSLKSRWVPKPPIIRRQSTMSNGSQGSASATTDDRRFTFSTISANSRRHPIIATMTQSRIEVLDSYTIPTATSPPTPSATTPAATPSSIDMASFMDSKNERLPVETDEALRRFIVISGIWVAFCENWSPAYSYSKTTCPPPLSTSATFKPSQPSRAVSMSFIDTPRSASPASTSDENKRTIPRIIRTGTQLLHRNASFNNTASDAGSPVPSPTVKTRQRRSNSAGNAADLMNRTGSTKKRFGLALEDQPVPETEEERQTKRSSEILRIKELALPSPSSALSPKSTLTPIPSAEPPASTRSPSPASSNSRDKRRRSAYNPVTTAGMWDSGVSAKRRLRMRPTSLVVLNEKMEKAKRKEARSKSKDKSKPKEKREKKEKKEKEGRRKSESFKQLFTGIFRKEKSEPSPA